MKPLKVAVLVGSLRKESYSRKIAKALEELASTSYHFSLIEIGGLPLYNEDLDQGIPPESWSRFRQEMAAAEAVLFVTPEYNRSVPGVLKNALDVGSRPYGASIWDGKPGGIISVSIGAIGGFGANHHLRQSLVFLNVPVMQQPEAYLGGISDVNFDDKSQLTDERLKQFLQNYLQQYEKWVRKLKS